MNNYNKMKFQTVIINYTYSMINLCLRDFESYYKNLQNMKLKMIFIW